MSESSWCCRECDEVNEWGEATCKKCGACLYDLAVEMGVTKPPAANVEIERLRKRIGELERENANLQAKWERHSYGFSHYLTNEQINAAVAFAGRMGWKVLNKLHVHECEGCGGCGKIEPSFTHITGMSCPDCAPWGSEGWVIRKENDDGMDDD